VIFEGPLTIEKWEKHCKTNVSKGKSLSVHNPSGSAAPSKLFLWVLMAAVFPFEMFTTGALKFKHQIS
jgi:hypothetical protein